MMRIGAAAAPRWWGVERRRLPDYLAHVTSSGATSVELIVHHGPATRDTSSVHLDHADWIPALAEAARRGLHVNLHNSLDPRFNLGRWASDRDGLQADMRPVLRFLAEIETRQGRSPVLVVHAADGCPDAEVVTGDALGWIADELRRLACTAVVCVELCARRGREDNRFDRDRDRLTACIESWWSSGIGLCWDVANEWLSARRLNHELTLPSHVPPCVRHVHLHDASSDGSLHAPLGEGGVPWEAALTLLNGVGWAGSVTLEIRYRSAHDIGDPWTVLGESLRRALSVR